MENYTLMLNIIDYSDLIHSFKSEQGYVHLIKNHSYPLKENLICTKMSKPEMCLMLMQLDRQKHPLKETVRIQLLSQDEQFENYYDALKRDLSKFCRI